MQTTLRVDDHLYRAAKAEAAREGISLTRFLEEGLRLRLEKKSAAPSGLHPFRVYAAARSDSREWAEIRRVAAEDEEARELANLGLATRPS